VGYRSNIIDLVIANSSAIFGVRHRGKFFAVRLLSSSHVNKSRVTLSGREVRTIAIVIANACTAVLKRLTEWIGDRGGSMFPARSNSIFSQTQPATTPRDKENLLQKLLSLSNWQSEVREVTDTNETKASPLTLFLSLSLFLSLKRTLSGREIDTVGPGRARPNIMVTQFPIHAQHISSNPAGAASDGLAGEMRRQVTGPWQRTGCRQLLPPPPPPPRFNSVVSGAEAAERGRRLTRYKNTHLHSEVTGYEFSFHNPAGDISYLRPVLQEAAFYGH